MGWRRDVDSDFRCSSLRGSQIDNVGATQRDACTGQHFVDVVRCGPVHRLLPVASRFSCLRWSTELSSTMLHVIAFIRRPRNKLEIDFHVCKY